MALDKFEKLDKYYVPYLQFDLGTGISLTTNPRNYPDYSVSFEHTRKTAQVGSFTLNITYVPYIGEGSSVAEAAAAANKSINSASDAVFSEISPGVVNYIEKLLTDNYEKSNSLCSFRYGYLKSSLTSTYKDYISEEFTGTIFDYKISLSEGMINYTIIGYDTAGTYSQGSDDQAVFITSNPTGLDNINAMNDIAFSEYNGESVDNVHPVKAVEWLLRYAYPGVVGEGDWSLALSNDANTRLSSMTISGDILSVSEVSSSDDIQLVMSKAQSVLDVASSIDGEGKFVLSSDTQSKKLNISYIPTYSTAGCPSTESVKFRFEWNSCKDKGFGTTQFTIDFKGTTALTSSVAGADRVNEASIGTDSNVYRQEGSTKSISGTHARTYGYSNISLWSSQVSYPYSASLTTLGHPELNVSDLVEINPLYRGVPHHSKGTYMITSVVNRIAKSEGFTSSFGLVKISDQLSS